VLCELIHSNVLKITRLSIKSNRDRPKESSS
jgi:hypothetical protein